MTGNSLGVRQEGKEIKKQPIILLAWAVILFVPVIDLLKTS